MTLRAETSFRFSIVVVDLTGLPDEIRYGPLISTGEYRRVLDMVAGTGWSWLKSAPGTIGLVPLVRLEVRRG